MRTLTLISTTIAALAVAAPAQASGTPPVIHTPMVGLPRDGSGLLVCTQYQIPEGHAAKIVYTIKRHRTDRPGFKVVGTVVHIVATADGADHALVRWSRIGGRFDGFGYRVTPRILDVSTALTDTAKAGKIHI